jgi:hypothetical protein
VKKATPFKQAPARPTPQDNWVSGETAPPPATEKKEPIARLTLDLPKTVHTAFKVRCAAKEVRMLDVLRDYIVQWTRENA